MSFGKGLQLGILGFSIVLAMAKAEAKSCSELSSELHSMQTAQTSLLQSMVRKNESMASTLDQYADNFSVRKAVRKADIVGFHKSAQAFRNHQDREEKLVQRFQSKTDELISSIDECLKSKTIASQ